MAGSSSWSEGCIFVYGCQIVGSQWFCPPHFLEFLVGTLDLLLASARCSFVLLTSLAVSSSCARDAGMRAMAGKGEARNTTRQNKAWKCKTLSSCAASDPCFSTLSIDKNFEDDDSVDGGRSSSSSKGASQCGKKPVSMGSFRRPSSAKAAGENGNKPWILNIILLWFQRAFKGLMTTTPTPLACNSSMVLSFFSIICPVNCGLMREASNKKCIFQNNIHAHLFIALLAHF